MQHYTITVLENITRGDRFEAFRPETSELRFVTVLEVEAVSENEALDEAWAIGNRAPNIFAVGGTGFPENARSTSVGDVLIIGPFAWAVADMGFEAVRMADVRTASAR